MKVENPFQPSWGTAPPVLAGRSEVIAQIRSDLERGPGKAEFHHVLYGARGMGKTVLVSEITRQIEQDWRWVTVRYTGTPSWAPADAVMQQQPRLLDDLRRVRRPKLAGGVTVGVPGVASGHVETSVVASSREFVTMLTELGEQARSRKRGVLIAIDEVQRATARPDLELLGHAVQLVERDLRLPVSLLIAGLHDTPAHLAASGSFLERQGKLELGRLNRDASRVAFVEPLLRAGWSVDDDVLRAVLDRIDGVPFFTQLWGKEAFDATVRTRRLTSAELPAIAARVGAFLITNIFEPRLEQLNPTEQAIALALAARGDSAAFSDIAHLLGRTTQQLSSARAALLHKHHLVHSPAVDRLMFDVPGIGDWIRATFDLAPRRLALPEAGRGQTHQLRAHLDQLRQPGPIDPGR